MSSKIVETVFPILEITLSPIVKTLLALGDVGIWRATVCYLGDTGGFFWKILSLIWEILSTILGDTSRRIQPSTYLVYYFYFSRQRCLDPRFESRQNSVCHPHFPAPLELGVGGEVNHAWVEASLPRKIKIVY